MCDWTYVSEGLPEEDGLYIVMTHEYVYGDTVIRQSMLPFKVNGSEYDNLLWRSAFAWKPAPVPCMLPDCMHTCDWCHHRTKSKFCFFKETNTDKQICDQFSFENPKFNFLLNLEKTKDDKKRG